MDFMAYMAIRTRITLGTPCRCMKQDIGIFYIRTDRPDLVSAGYSHCGVDTCILCQGILELLTRKIVELLSAELKGQKLHALSSLNLLYNH